MSGRKGKETTIEERKIILRLHSQQKSYADIAKIVNRTRSTVQYIIKRFENENNIENKHRNGRPKLLTVREERKILQLIQNNPRLNAPAIAKNIEEHFNKKVSSDTIRRVLKRAGLKSCIARKKPYINATNRKKRLDFAKQYIIKLPDFWNQVIFSDESKFNIFGSDGQIRIWRKSKQELNPKNLQSTVKHGGGGVMVWGCMSSRGVGKLVIIEGIMDKYLYLNILKENLKESANLLGIGNGFYFQQDNDPKHTAYVVRQWIAFNTPHILPTPPQSPDLNPIEHLWDELERRVRQHIITSKTQLKSVLLEEWQNISTDLTQKLVASMPHRLSAVLKSRGYPTKY